MKWMIALLLSLGLYAQAQTATVRDIPTDKETNITIGPGEKSQRTYEIVDEKADIQGEPELLTKEARASWKKACADWKAETKELNKENQIMALSCNHPTCGATENATTTCKSVGTYKIKTRVK